MFSITLFFSGERLEPLYGPIRHKLANALTSWHPSDPSAKMILQPWMKVWQKGHAEAFLVKNIAPKLSLCLNEFVINPHQQHLGRYITEKRRIPKLVRSVSHMIFYCICNHIKVGLWIYLEFDELFWVGYLEV